VIALEQIRRSWGAFSLDISLTVETGGYLVILGPSGCGKSLLLGTVAGLYPPDAGAVRIGERDVTGDPPEKRGVGFVFQRAALFPHLDVAGNIEFGRQPLRLLLHIFDRRIDSCPGCVVRSNAGVVSRDECVAIRHGTLVEPRTVFRLDTLILSRDCRIGFADL